MTEWLNLRVTDSTTGQRQKVEVVDSRGNVLGELARVTKMSTTSVAHEPPQLTVTLNVSAYATEA